MGVQRAVTPRHLYVHAPFCARRCSYCDFAVTVDAAPDARSWLSAVETELAGLARRRDWSFLSFRTIYVGGGTPSLLGLDVMRQLGRRLSAFTDLAETEEWTSEANPEHFDEELARAWREAGVSRLSLGAQTFDPDVLRWMGRLHGPDGPRRAMAAARAAGFGDISLDLIFGLPGRFGRDWRSDLERALELEPEHLSLYGLTAEPGAPLGRWVAEGRESLADEETYADEYLLAAELLTGAGYSHYEVSNFARPGCESRHNQAYWSGVPYIGLGPGAHSYLPPRRWWNVRDWAAYHDRIQSGSEAVDGEETVAAGASSLEHAWLRLRTADGAELRSAEQQDLAEAWQAKGWARCDDSRVRLTAAGWLLLDRLAMEFDECGLNSARTAETLRS